MTGDLFPDARKPKLATVDQVSSGGIAFRASDDAGVEVALISVGKENRWQLPKGIVDKGETPEVTAVREVQEETGIDTELLQKIDTIEYWYVGNKGKERVRFHKFVHFFLLRYTSGHINKHDWEVNEARWVTLAQAKQMLTFKSEKQALEKAEKLLDLLHL
ncbi:NUDIX hydrolase [Pontibacter akesuensis]|uniref:NUDIX domain-containing protein n=1 Tax=Pontibacter akesuensis TaxID=388950 RepID=A0A1I7JE95_9BACT|nr:NUDIX hydrolase [Pontibacter akesuensis]GHA70562.1 NUDIX hydrolase [Pontibacter akesuensis]SFU83495.1 NUDIX domain-containing protein [Pontibacter akesuensis]